MRKNINRLAAEAKQVLMVQNECSPAFSKAWEELWQESQERVTPYTKQAVMELSERSPAFSKAWGELWEELQERIMPYIRKSFARGGFIKDEDILDDLVDSTLPRILERYVEGRDFYHYFYISMRNEAAKEKQQNKRLPTSFTDLSKTEREEMQLFLDTAEHPDPSEYGREELERQKEEIKRQENAKRELKQLSKNKGSLSPQSRKIVSAYLTHFAKTGEVPTGVQIAKKLKKPYTNFRMAAVRIREQLANIEERKFAQQKYEEQKQREKHQKRTEPLRRLKRLTRVADIESLLTMLTPGLRKIVQLKISTLEETGKLMPDEDVAEKMGYKEGKTVAVCFSRALGELEKRYELPPIQGSHGR